MTINPQYVTDKSGERMAAMLPIKEFNSLLEKLEDYEDILLFREGKKDKDPGAPAEEVFKRIEAKRAKKNG
jgi:hypothetical protein